MKTKECRNCGQKFEITNSDLEFYKKMNVPEPAECYDCRQQRRMAYRNERKLYKNVCGLCKKDIITIYSPDKPEKVYCTGCWWSDKWDPLEYGRKYDFNRPFFEQWEDLWSKVPKLALIVLGDNINSEYTHDNYKLQNCYLIFDGEQAQDCYYGETFSLLKNCMDFLQLHKSELCYECINSTNCYNCKFVRFSQNCSESAFLIDCNGCRYCFGCANLHRKEYYIFNKPHSKAEYEKKVGSFNIRNYRDLEKFKKEFEKFTLTQPKKAMRGYRNENVTGDNIFNSKNTFESYDCNGLRDCKFCTNVVMGANDCFDVDIWGDRLSRAYNCDCAGAGGENIIASYYAGFSGSNIFHCAFCFRGAHNIFGSVGLRHKEFCILNKQYAKEEYAELLQRIIAHMKRTGEWGEFFPIKTSAFGYNETVAQEYFPLTREEALKKGYKWKEKEAGEYKPATCVPPGEIENTPDTILDEILACASCGKNYKIIAQELRLYKKMDIPIPQKCPDCRHTSRMRLRNPRRLWKRKCEKCGAEIKTTYSPDRPEIVYCEECYLKEMY